MTLTPSKTSSTSAPMGRPVQRLRNRLHELDQNFMAWDSQGRPLSRGQAASPLCEVMMGVSQHFMEATGAAAGRALAQKVPVTAVAPCGGCVLAVPVLRRRRVMGAVTVCFPTREALEDGTLARHWRRCGLDERSFGRAAHHCVRHSRRQAGDFLKLLAWLIESEQDADIARSETETLSANLANTYEELSLLYLISGSMKVNQAPADFFRHICENLVEVMHLAGAAAVVYAHPRSGGEDLVVRSEGTALEAPGILALARQRIAPRFVNHRATLDNDFRAEIDGAPVPVSKLIAAPMVAEESLLGMLVGLDKEHGEFDSVDLKLIGSIANQAAVFVSNSRLYAEVQDLLMGVLHALTASIDAKDPYTSGHSSRVAVISRRIAERMELPSARVQQVYMAGLLHDIGKIGIPESVLRKPGRLSEEEFQIVRAHPAIGAKILGGIRQLDEVMPGIYTHHERPDGNGYPQGLRGEELPQDGRIVGLADAFDAMTSERTYRKALELPVVVEELRRLRGAQFDPVVVEVFLSLDVESLLEELRQPASTVFPPPYGQEPQP